MITALFSGAAVYINFAEHSARLQLEDGPLLKRWKPSYKRGFAMQATLAPIGLLPGMFAWFLNDDWHGSLGANVLVSNWPFTLIAIMPVNNQLMEVI